MTPMKYFVAFGSSLFCFLCVVVLVLYAVGNVWLIAAALRWGIKISDMYLYYRGKDYELPTLFWVVGLSSGGLLGVVAGYHSFRASLAAWKQKKIV